MSASAAESVTTAEEIKLSGKTGKYEITIDVTETPDLKQWAEDKLMPVALEWYPQLVAMLPSEGYEAPETVSITFSKDMRGVAAAGGNRIRCAGEWFRKNLEGEARGAVVHELVHVVQNYGWGRRRNPEATRTPGWVVEGIPDYIRWFIYEPETRGAEITQRNFERAKYDANYRISGNFLNWVSVTQGHDVIVKLNAAAREGKYREELWKEWTDQTLEELKSASNGRKAPPLPANREPAASGERCLTVAGALPDGVPGRSQAILLRVNVRGEESGVREQYSAASNDD
jgi:hypothetical protein